MKSHFTKYLVASLLTMLVFGYTANTVLAADKPGASWDGTVTVNLVNGTNGQ